MTFDTTTPLLGRAKIMQMLERLSEIPFFEGFDSRQLGLLRPIFESFSCPDKTVIFQQGDEAVFLYLILNGDAVIQYKPYDSPAITLTRLHSGDVFGWSAVVGNPTYSSSILSEGPLEAIRIRGTDLVALCHKHPTTGSTILNRLARGVSGRWKDAHIQVKSMLRVGVERSVVYESDEG